MLETVEDGLTDTKGIAQFASVSSRTIQNWVDQKKIPVIRLSPRCVRFSRRAVARAIDRFTVKEAA